MAVEDTLVSSLFVINLLFDFAPLFSAFPCFIDFYFDCLNHFEVFMNLTVSIDRFSSIIIPIEHKVGDFLTQKYPKLISLFALILSALINIVPLVLEYPIYDKENKYVLYFFNIIIRQMLSNLYVFKATACILIIQQ